MRTVLVPTDFSKDSICVIPVATEIAKKKNEKIALLHSYFDFGSDSEREHARKRMKMLFEIYGLEDYPHRCFLKKGDFISSIDNVSSENDLSMIVMCKGGGPERITSFVIHRSEIPVLTVPRGTELSGINNIVYVTDTLSKEQETALRAIDLARSLQTKILFLNVRYRYGSAPDKDSDDAFISRLKSKYPLVSSEIIYGSELDFSFTNYATDLVIMEKLSPLMNLNRFDKKDWVRQLILQQQKPALFYPAGKSTVQEAGNATDTINISYAV